PAGDGTLTVAVLDLKGSKGTEGIARALTTLVNNEIGARPGWKSLSRNELKSLLAHQGDQRFLGCEDPQCVGDIGKLAKTDRVVFGSVELAEGGAAVLSLTLVDPEGPTVLERVAWTWKSNLEDMVDLARPAVDRLVLGKKAEELTGGAEILAPSGADIVVDDKQLGAAPLAPLKALAIGPHHVEVRKGGYLPWDKDIAVHANENSVVQADLVDETSVQPFYARWYVWGSALAAVVVVGGTAAGIGTYQYLSTPAKLVVGAPK
ncbi:MAG TPA: PEGA domain-containing protein, partial [Myxococcota bacterium]